MRRALALGSILAVTVTAAILPASADTAAPTAVGDVSLGWDRSDAPQRTLRDGTAAEVGLTQEFLDAIEPALEAGLDTEPNPLYPGAVSLVAAQGVVVDRTSTGHALRWADATTELPAEEWVPMAPDTIFDLASLSKLFTAVSVMQLVEDGEIALDDTAASYLPAFGANGKEEVTLTQLLTHTAGLPAWVNLYSAPDAEASLQRVYDVALATPPGTRYVYSDLGLITLGKIVEEVSGLTLDAYVAEHITGPLGMTDTMYTPPAELLGRIAATEYQATPDRGLVHGEVHDENAWALDGVAGHAGVFSTADDVAVFGQMLLNGGVYDGARILEAATVEEMMQDYTGQLGADHRGLGPELEAWFYHDVLTSADSAGHTGYTGTSLVIDPRTETIAVLMTNRVHPSRAWGSINPARRAVARAAGLATPVTGFGRDEAWYSGIGDELTNTLTFDVTAPDGADLELDLWYHTEPTDLLHVEASDDDGETWVPLDGTLTAGTVVRESDGTVAGDGEWRWWDADFALGDLSGEVTVRLRYVTDANTAGRGVYLDRITVTAGAERLFDDWLTSDAATITADGWYRVAENGLTPVDTAPVEQFRAYWVDAFNEGIYSPAQVSELVSEAQNIGANALVVQVGRRFDCFCNDSAFPRTQAGIDAAPYDPLEEVIDQAHAAGIEVHAWVNATTLWNSATAPTDPEHAYNQHGPDAEGADSWLNVKVNGDDRAGNNTYIDPAHPDAVDYMVDGIASITENYDVDGVNLDYIRYPDFNATQTQNDWGYSELSLSRFAAATGRTDRPAPDDPEFSDWRRDQVSNLVRKIYVSMYEVDPQDRLSINGITYSFGPPSYEEGWEGTRPYAEVLQDWRGWFDEGIIDTITAMNYKRNWMPDQAQMFAEWNAALVEYRGDRHAVSGPALYLNEVEDSVAQAQQIVELGLDGWSGYSYANPSLTANASPSGAVKDAERDALAIALRADVFAEDAVVPEMTWKTQPTTGTVSGRVELASGDVADQVDVVLVPVEGTAGEPVAARTDGSGWFGVLDLAPGRYRVETVEDTGTAPVVATIVAGEVTDVSLVPGEDPTDPPTDPTDPPTDPTDPPTDPTDPPTDPTDPPTDPTDPPTDPTDPPTDPTDPPTTDEPTGGVDPTGDPGDGADPSDGPTGGTDPTDSPTRPGGALPDTGVGGSAAPWAAVLLLAGALTAFAVRRRAVSGT
ncbi:serine hydrolase [Georgenia faecalis]|uniref:Serine hydrolase n=2 Tax=Georgenia faecalis TaxID=2483799 RepID=A0ABV9DAA0_9MICO